MPVVISEIITETTVAPTDPSASATISSVPDLDLVVRRAVERVLEVLRREWDQ
ncbi:hypothetical protein [Nocardioides immobilis]|uniref:hypothetical protein n=1 Tax=Nocardioides immobilis TaxID=2049295 RepID=UPI0015F7BCF3|nr:hypothetical protein [Nocardioides immobilis]